MFEVLFVVCWVNLVMWVRFRCMVGRCVSCGVVVEVVGSRELVY